LEVNLAAMVGEYQYPKVLMILLSDFIKKAWPHCNVNVLKMKMAPWSTLSSHTWTNPPSV